METQKLGVVAILEEGELVGIIYNDVKARTKTMYSCTPMGEDEMIAIIEGKVEKKVVSVREG